MSGKDTAHDANALETGHLNGWRSWVYASLLVLVLAVSVVGGMVVLPSMWLVLYLPLMGLFLLVVLRVAGGVVAEARARRLRLQESQFVLGSSIVVWTIGFGLLRPDGVLGWVIWLLVTSAVLSMLALRARFIVNDLAFTPPRTRVLRTSLNLLRLGSPRVSHAGEPIGCLLQATLTMALIGLFAVSWVVAEVVLPGLAVVGNLVMWPFFALSRACSTDPSGERKYLSLLAMPVGIVALLPLFVARAFLEIVVTGSTP